MDIGTAAVLLLAACFVIFVCDLLSANSGNGHLGDKHSPENAFFFMVGWMALGFVVFAILGGL